MTRKKNLLVNKRLYNKIDESFQNLIFEHNVDLSISGLELIVTDSVSVPIHTLSTRALYEKEGKKSVAFRPVRDEIKWPYPDSLAEDYAKKIVQELDSRIYEGKASGNKVHIQAKITKDDIEKAIEEYIKSKGGSLTQGEFQDLIEASEAQLVECFGDQHDTITNRQYSPDDVMRFSKEYFKRAVFEKVRGRKFYNTKYKLGANIMNIYRKIIAKTLLPEGKTISQKTLFG